MYAKDRKTVIDHREYLRVKVLSLGVESQIIRFQEKKTPDGEIREGLYLHRIKVVRKEARSAHLAYGFVKGKRLSQMEPKSFTPPDWKRIRTLVERYGPKTVPEGFLLDCPK